MSSVKHTEIEGDVAVGRNVEIGGKATVRGKMTVDHDLKVKGDIEANDIRANNKGVFLSVERLTAAYPTPEEGWFAGVLETVNDEKRIIVYDVENGEWTRTGVELDVELDQSEEAIAAASAAAEAAAEAKTATTATNTAAKNATTAAGNANTAAKNATTAAGDANTAASNATTAAGNANTAANAATTAAEKAEAALKTIDSRLFINANKLLLRSEAMTLSEALKSISSLDKAALYTVNGIVLTFLTANGWKRYQWIGDEWMNIAHWEDISQSSSGAGFYNIDNEKPLEEGYYSLDSAVSAVSKDTSIGATTRNGMILQFFDGEKWRYYAYQLEYDASDPEADDKFSNPENWAAFESGSGGGTVNQYVLKLETNSARELESSDTNLSVNLRFSSQIYDSISQSLIDSGEDASITIERQMEGAGRWTTVATIGSFPSTPAGAGNYRTVDLSPYLQNGTQYVRFTAKGNVSGQTAPLLTFTVGVAAMSAEIATNWGRAFVYDETVASSGTIAIPVKMTGNVHKILYYEVLNSAGTKIKEGSIEVGTAEYVESAYTGLTFEHPQTAEILTIRVRLRYGNSTVYTDWVEQNFMVSTVASSAVLLCVNNVKSQVYNWTSERLLEYAVYNPGALTGSVVGFELRDSEEQTVWMTGSNGNAENGIVYDYTPYLGIENNTPSGRVRLFGAKLRVSVGGVLMRTLTYSVDNSNNFAPTAGANFVLMPSSRSNYDSDRTVIHNETSLATEAKELQGVWENVTFEDDGWVTEGDVKMLRLFASSKLTIPFECYSNTTQENGLTIEVDARMRNISDEDAAVLKIGKEVNGQFVGLILYPKRGYFFKTTNNVAEFQDIEWQENKRTHLTVNIAPRLNVKGRTLNVVRLFVNDKINREFTFTSADRFWDGSGSGGIQIGGEGCDIDVFGMRVFKERLLSSGEVLNDVVAAESDIEKKKALIEANNIMEGGVIKYALAKEKYNTMVWEGVFPDKNNQVETTGNLRLSILNDLIHSGRFNNMKCKGQGTSSKRYLYWNGSWSFNDDSLFVNDNGDPGVPYYQLRDGSPRATKLVGKRNWASSPQSHKEGMCDIVNAVYDALFDGSAGWEPSGIKRTAGYENTKIAVEEEPFLFFVQATPDSEPVFDGMMTFGSAKGDKLTFGYDKSHPILKDYLMMEGSDQTPVLGLCQVPWFEDEVSYNEEEEYYEYNGMGSFDVTLGNRGSIGHFIEAFNTCYKYSTRINYYNGRLDDLQQDATADKSYQYFVVGQTYDNFYVYRYNWPTGRWVNAGTTKTNGAYDAVNLNEQLGLHLDPSSADFDGMLAQVKAARVAAFRAVAGNHFHVNDTLYGMQINKLMAASDNRNKNTYPYYDPVDGVIRFGSDDNDTILPFNNQGQKQKPYWVEEHDYDSRPQFNGYFWAASGNAMYNLFEDAYPNELRTMMRRILAAMANLGSGYGEGGVMGCFDRYFFKIQNYFPAVAYNEVARLSYEWAKILYDAGEYTNDTDPITQSLGDQLECEKEWVRRRIVYIASYCMYNAAMGGSIEYRQLNSATYKLRPAMKMYMYMQLGTSYRYPTGSSAPKRCESGEEVTIVCEGSDSIQTYIVGAEYLQDLGDLSAVGVTGSTAFANGKRLARLKVGNANASAVNFRPSAVASFPANAVEIDLRNTAVPSVGSLAGVTKLERYYGGGTAITSLTLPQTNLLTDVELNEQLQTLVLRNQTGINHFVFTPTALRSLTSGRCNVIDQQFVENWLDGLSGDLSGYELEMDGIRWTNFSEDKLLKLLQFGTCILQGTIAMNSLSPSTKITLMNMYGNIDDENNSLYVTYPNGVSISGDKTVIRGGAGDVTITVSIIKYVDDAQITIRQTGNFFTLVSEGEIQYDPVTGSATKQYVYHTETLMGTSTNFSAQAVIDGVTYTSRNFNVAGTVRITITSAVIKKMVDGSLVDGSYYYTEDKAAENNTFYIVPNTTDGRNAFVDDQGNPIPTDTYRIEWGISDLPSSLDECYLEYEGIGDNEVVKVMKQNVGGAGVEICRMPKYPNPANKAQWWNSITFSSYVNEVDAERLGNDPDFKIVANLIVTNRTAAAIQTSLCPIVGHPEFFAVQAYDPTKPNYNPAVCVILEQGGLLDRTQLYTDGGNMYIDPVTGNQGLVMTMDEAAVVTDSNLYKKGDTQIYRISIFQNKTTVTPTNITDCYEQAESYNFEYFYEFRFFKNVELDFRFNHINGGVWNAVAYGLFRSCSKLKDLYLPKNMKYLRSYNNSGGTIQSHFYNCTSLIAPASRFNNIISIGDVGGGNHYGSVFGNCTALQWETLPENVSFIGYTTFDGCTNLNIHTIPSALTHIYCAIPGDWDYVPDTIQEMEGQYPQCTELSLPYGTQLSNFGGFSSNIITNVVFRKGDKETISYKLPKFNNCANLEVLNPPDIVNAFNGGISGTKIKFFSLGCDKLHNLSVGNKLADIDNSNLKFLRVIANNLMCQGAQNDFYIYRPPFDIVVFNINDITNQSGVQQTFDFNFRQWGGKVAFNIDTPPAWSFRGTNAAITIYVPINSLSAYQAASNWNSGNKTLKGYDFELDEAHLLSATNYNELDLSKLPS